MSPTFEAFLCKQDSHLNLLLREILNTFSFYINNWAVIFKNIKRKILDSKSLQNFEIFQTLLVYEGPQILDLDIKKNRKN